MYVRFDGHCPALQRTIAIDATQDPELVLDARRLTWASPVDLTGLVAWAHCRAATGARLVMPTHPDAANYLCRMDVTRTLEAAGVTIEGDPPAEDRQDRRHRLIEVRQIIDDNNIEDFVSSVYMLVDANVGARPAALVHTMLGELLANIPHAQSPVGAFGAAQVYSGATSGQPGIEISVADPGRGILASLRNNPEFADLEDEAAAIRASLRKGVSGNPAEDQADAAGRGNGLPHIVRQLHRHQGVFVLRSGAAVARVRTRSRSVDRSATATPGTWAWIRLNPENSPSDEQT